MAKMPFVHLAIFAMFCAVWIPFDVNCETSSSEDARLDEIGAKLQSVVRKNQELEIKMGHMEIELEAQKVLNSELKRRIEDLENKQQALDGLNQVTDSEENLSDSSQSINASMTKNRDSQIPRTMQSKIQAPRQKQVKGGLKRQVTYDTVAFTAMLSKRDLVNLGQSHFLVFDSVITNVGGAYHSTTGIFTAPVDGIYAFNMALHINAGSLIDVCFVKDGNEVMCNNGEARNSQDSKSTSRTVILELSKGNEVRTRTNSWSGYGIQQLHGNNYSAFSGWRIA